MPRYTLEALAAVLIVVWLVGWLVARVTGGLIHIALVLAMVAILARVFQGRSL